MSKLGCGLVHGRGDQWTTWSAEAYAVMTVFAAMRRHVVDHSKPGPSEETDPALRRYVHRRMG